MSSVHGFVILSEVEDAEAIARVNAWCAERDAEREQCFEPISMANAGGTKLMTCAVYAMAANHVGYAEELRMALPSFDWISPGSVVMYDVHEYSDNSAWISRAGVPA